jgi:hypothetical protein
MFGGRSIRGSIPYRILFHWTLFPVPEIMSAQIMSDQIKSNCEKKFWIRLHNLMVAFMISVIFFALFFDPTALALSLKQCSQKRSKWQQWQWSSPYLVWGRRPSEHDYPCQWRRYVDSWYTSILPSHHDHPLPYVGLSMSADFLVLLMSCVLRWSDTKASSEFFTRFHSFRTK